MCTVRAISADRGESPTVHSSWGHKKETKLVPEGEEIFNNNKNDEGKFKRNTMKEKEWPNPPHSGGAVPAGEISCVCHLKPGQCGKVDCCVLEDKSLEFFPRKIKAPKGK